MKISVTALRRRQISAALGLIAPALLLYSCVDLGKVNEFAKASQDIGTKFKNIVEEGSASCGRTQFYVLPGQNPPDCEFYGRVAPSLVNINDALFAYISSLGRLASA